MGNHETNHNRGFNPNHEVLTIITAIHAAFNLGLSLAIVENVATCEKLMDTVVEKHIQITVDLTTEQNKIKEKINQRKEHLWDQINNYESRLSNYLGSSYTPRKDQDGNTLYFPANIFLPQNMEGSILTAYRYGLVVYQYLINEASLAELESLYNDHTRSLYIRWGEYELNPISTIGDQPTQSESFQQYTKNLIS